MTLICGFIDRIFILNEYKVILYIYITMEQITAFKKNNNKNDTRNKKAFEFFINKKKEFGDDIFSVIKQFMIEPRYKNSYKFQQQRELRYCVSSVDATTFFIGRRYKNLIQVKLIRTDDNKLIEKPQFKFYKIQTMELKNGNDETDIILMEYVVIKFGVEESDYDGSVEVIYYMVGADLYKNKLWTEADNEIYDKQMRELQEQQREDYDDYIDDIEAMMD